MGKDDDVYVKKRRTGGCGWEEVMKLGRQHQSGELAWVVTTIATSSLLPAKADKVAHMVQLGRYEAGTAGHTFRYG